MIELISNYIKDKNLKNVILSKNKINSGPYINFNFLLKYHNKDDYGYWLLQGSDDISDKKRISTLVSFMEKNKNLKYCRSKYIRENSNLPIYFTGSESDMKQNPWMEKICDRIEIVHIRKSLSLVRDAKKIISNDTGLANCAGEMNKDLLILWKDTPFIKNQNPGKNTKYSQKDSWITDIKKYLN